MLDLFHIAKPQGCDLQTFYGTGGTSATGQYTWLKPRGVSHVYMMLIGGGGNGDNTSAGGGSGAVTVWYGAAQNVPDLLNVYPSRGNGNNTTVSVRVSNSGAAPTALLTANSSSSTAGATAMTANQFAASGFFQSVAGQSGATNDQAASGTTFLSGGCNSGTLDSNYGYQHKLITPESKPGFFMLRPIIVGSGGIAEAAGGIGCGGGFTNGVGGPGMVLIASW